MSDREAPQTRLKRLRMRSMRRGIREMDLILTAFADAELTRLSAADLRLYDRILDESDRDLYAWVTGQTPPPKAFADMIARISAALQRN